MFFHFSIFWIDEKVTKRTSTDMGCYKVMGIYMPNCERLLWSDEVKDVCHGSSVVFSDWTFVGLSEISTFNVTLKFEVFDNSFYLFWKLLLLHIFQLFILNWLEYDSWTSKLLKYRKTVDFLRKKLE